MKLAVVGSRHFNNYDCFKQTLYEYFHTDVSFSMPGANPWHFSIITGDASGVDEMARKFAKENNLELGVFNAEWQKYGKSAGPIRNTEIVKNSDIMIAFLGQGPGTKNAIKQMLAAGKPAIIIPIKET